MEEHDRKNAAREYFAAQRVRINQSRNARKWFYRGVVGTLAAGYLFLQTTKEDKTEENA